MSAGALVPSPVSTGATCSSEVYSTPKLDACRSRPVANLAMPVVWFETMVFSRSLPWRASVTLFVSGLYAATF